MIRILVVCTANVCRSPLGAALLSDAFARAGVEGIDVSSAGVRATPGSPACELSMALAPGGSQTATPHYARLLTAELVDGADLVLTADAGHRGAAAMLSPRAHGRIFTLREAEALARHLDAGPGGIPGQGIASLAHALNAARGSVQPAPVPRSLSGGLFPRPASFDIDDGHGLAPRRHRRALEEVAAASEALSRVLLARVLS